MGHNHPMVTSNRHLPFGFSIYYRVSPVAGNHWKILSDHWKNPQGEIIWEGHGFSLQSLGNPRLSQGVWGSPLLYRISVGFSCRHTGRVPNLIPQIHDANNAELILFIIYLSLATVGSFPLPSLLSHWVLGWRGFDAHGLIHYYNICYLCFEAHKLGFWESSYILLPTLFSPPSLGPPQSPAEAKVCGRVEKPMGFFPIKPWMKPGIQACHFICG